MFSAACICVFSEYVMVWLEGFASAAFVTRKDEAQEKTLTKQAQGDHARC